MAKNLSIYLLTIYTIAGSYLYADSNALQFCEHNIGEIKLLSNTSFEKGADCWQKKGNASHIEVYQWHPYKGKASYGIGNDKGPENAYGEIVQKIKMPQEIKEGDLFVFKAWMKSENNYNGKAGVELDFLDSGSKLIKTCRSKTLSGRFEWTKLTVKCQAPEGTNEVVAKCVSREMASAKNLSYVWFDNVSIDCPIITASSTLTDKFAPKNVLQEGKWHSKLSDNQWIVIDYQENKTFAGLAINWDDDYATSYELLISDDAKKWNLIYKAQKDKAGTDTIYTEQTSARFVKIVCNSSNGKGFGITEIETIEADGTDALKRYYQVVAEQTPARYPRWLSKKQAYWTTIGVEGDENEAIICEDGTVEPHKRGFTIAPMLYIDNKLITREDVEVSQSLEKDYLPIPSVKWDWQNIEMNVKLFVHGKRNESVAYIRYQINNKQKCSTCGKLFLAVCPLQIFPPWQNGGGFSKINKIERINDILKINDKYNILTLTEPDNFGCIAGSKLLKFPFKFPSPPQPQGDITAFLEKGTLPETKNLTQDEQGFASAALEYDFDLKPGQSKYLFIAVPLHDKMPTLSSNTIEAEYKKMLAETMAYWESRVSKLEIDIPEKNITNTLKSYIAYNLITKDTAAIQPGARSYEKSWIRDGGMAATALLKMGLTSEIREFIDWYSSFQYENGLVPPIIDTKAADPLWEEKPPHNLIEYDCQGEYIYTVFEYYKFTKDKEFLKGKLNNVKKALEYLVYLRSQRLMPEFKNATAEKRKYYGILPPSTSHEGYGCEYSYWDDFWALKGWKDGRDIFNILGKKDLAKWADDEYKDFKKCFYDSVRATIDFYKVDYIPASASLGDIDPTSTAVAIMYCDELENLPEKELNFTFEQYYKDLSSRFEPNAKYRFTPYELRTTPALFYMGQKEKGLALLRFMLKCRRPLEWNQLAEVVNSDYRFPGYFGDMPHTWVGAEYINSVRSLFAYETGGKLILGHGIDGKWLSRKQGISVKNMPTYYGKINYSIKMEGSIVKIKAFGEAKADSGFIFKSPFLTRQIDSVEINNKKTDEFCGNEIFFEKLPVKITIKYSN